MPTTPPLRRRLRALLPEGGRLLPAVFERRHRAAVRIAFAQSVAVFVFGLVRGIPVWHSALEAGAVAALAAVARFGSGPPVIRACYATLSLMVTSAMFVHQAEGITEAHFHFFVMVALITLYQAWEPFAVAIAFVVLHHAVAGSFDPTGVYGTPAAIAAPWRWAMAHGAFVLAAAAVNVMGWRLSEEQGVTDPLTGLHNRVGFTALVDRRLAHFEVVSVLFIDFDHFKRVNDSLGHEAGDEVLRVLAERIRATLPDIDSVARLGGDEFAAVLPGIDAADAEQVADRVLHVLSDPIYLRSARREVRLRASAGLAQSRPGLDGAELVRRADIAMSTAKADGGGRFVTFEDSFEVLQRERAELADELGHAVADGQLHLVYQPVFDLRSGEVLGVEALTRWQHPDRGTIPPDRFIPIAEESDLIVELGTWILDEAIRQVVSWRDAGLELVMGVNVSTRQLEQEDFVDVVQQLLAKHGAPPTQLLLELTESVLVADLDEVGQRLNVLRALGIRVAIDDFGTGYASMSYLSRLPVDVVKIDHSFVRRLGSDSTDSALVRSVIDLAATLGLGTVAEGVERVDQMETLQRLQCQTAQGYLLSAPVEPAAVPVLARASRINALVAGF